MKNQNLICDFPPVWGGQPISNGDGAISALKNRLFQLLGVVCPVERYGLCRTFPSGLDAGQTIKNICAIRVRQGVIRRLMRARQSLVHVNVRLPRIEAWLVLASASAPQSASAGLMLITCFIHQGEIYMSIQSKGAILASELYRDPSAINKGV